MTEGIPTSTDANDAAATETPADAAVEQNEAAPVAAAAVEARRAAPAPSPVPAQSAAPARFAPKARPAPAWAPTPAVFESEMQAVPGRGGSRLAGPMLFGWTAILVLGVAYAVFWYVRQEAGVAAASASTSTDARVQPPQEMGDVEVNPNLIDPRLKSSPRAVPVQRDPFGRGRGSQPAKDGFAQFVPAVYPTEQLIDQEVKGLSAFTEDAGLQLLRARMLSPQRSGSLIHQPVDFGAHGDFQSVLTWVADLHQSRPGWVIGWMQLTPLGAAAAGRPSPRVNASVSLWAYAESGSAAAGKVGMPTYPRMDLSGALRELAAGAGNTPVKFLELHLGPDTAPTRGPSDGLRLKGWVTAVAPSLNEVNDFAVRLARSDVLSDVTLVDDGSAAARRGGPHKLKIEFRANPLAKPSQAAAAVPDPFRLNRPEAVAGAEDPLVPTPDDVARQLRLQAVVGKACMINNRSYRVGDVVDGYTLVQITEQGVVVVSGTNRVELKLAKK
jgi:hypothetical protein